VYESLSSFSTVGGVLFGHSPPCHPERGEADALANARAQSKDPTNEVNRPMGSFDSAYGFTQDDKGSLRMTRGRTSFVGSFGFVALRSG
jgi:hypothetical protein